MKLFRYILLYLCWLILIYLGFSFIEFQANPFKWERMTRLMFVMMNIMPTIGLFFGLFNETDH